MAKIKCPKCGSFDLHFYAFSIDVDCRVKCNACGFEIESEVSWEDCDSEKEHDKKCYEHLVELLSHESNIS